MQARMLRQALRGSIVALALPLGVAVAQDACKINDGSPFQLAGARNYVTMAANAKYPSEIPKHLNNAFKVLTDDPEKIKNETGRQFLLLRTYAQYLQRDGASFMVKRGDLGFSTNPSGPHNILLAIDTAVNVISAAMPECKAKVEVYRNKFMSEIFSKSVQALQSEQPDSALFYAKLASQAAPADPRPWNVMVAVYEAKKDADSIRYAMRKVVELAGEDTAYRKIAQQHRYNLAILALNDAETQEGAARDASVSTARKYLQEYLKVEPGNPTGTQAMGRALRLSGDTAAVTALFKEMIDHPDRYTDIQLLEGASNAAAAKQYDEAAKLFDAGLAKNPYDRFGLQNAANVYFNIKDAAKMEPLARRLVEIEPNGQNARQVFAAYWQVRQRGETDAAKKKMYADSALIAFTAVQELSPKVEITQSSKKGNNYVLAGTVTNASDKERSWTIKFELLDVKGTPVGTREVNVGPIGPNNSAPFNVSVEAPKAVAFRYAPLAK